MRIVTSLFLTLLTLLCSLGVAQANNFQICGEELSNILTLVCNGSFNKRSGGTVKRSLGERYKRTTGVVQECCYTEGGCSLQTLMMYCAHDSSDSMGSLLQLLGAYNDPMASGMMGNDLHGGHYTSDDVPNGGSNMAATQTPAEQIFRMESQMNQQRLNEIPQRPRFRPRIALPGQEANQNDRKWFFLPLPLGPNPTRRPFERP